MFLYSRFYFGFFESVFGIFSLLSFGNSPLFPAKQQRKSTQKQFSNNSEIKFKQLLKELMNDRMSVSRKKSLPSQK